MNDGFTGFPKAALTFFRQLERNNKREWFQPRKAIFEERVRGPMVRLVASLNEDLLRFAADHVVEPRRAIYRIYRDTRFARDKTPYKTHIGALFNRPGLERHAGAAYYVGVSHADVEVAGGVYGPGPAELAAIRRAIADDLPRFRKLIAPLQKAFGPLGGESLARVPKGFDPRHPAADLLRHKQFYFAVTLPASAALDKSLRREVAKRFRAMTPFMNYLNAILLAAAEQSAGKSDRPVRPAPMF